MMGTMEGFKRLFAQDALPVRWLRNTGMNSIVDTTDCFEAISTFKSTKNFLFIVILLTLLALQAIFWTNKLGFINYEPCGSDICDCRSCTFSWQELQGFNINKTDTVIGIAASGKTPYVVGAVKNARKNGILTACISSNPGTILAQNVDIAIEAIVGPEFVTGSTRMKSGTAQKLILNMITTTLMIQLGRVKGNKMVNMLLTNKKLIERGTKMITDELGYPESKAKRLLLLHGSVQKVLDEVDKKSG